MGVLIQRPVTALIGARAELSERATASPDADSRARRAAWWP
ncbi:hypothetical protein AACH06_04085 [Ideonella sp. DXS29W]|uniref:Uncharacterized protein n=1 Tax=Ideonella lacteola TaxID=2984193 RepID=A0ABU9BJ42_9BURK